jgi:carboxylesterase type B
MPQYNHFYFLQEKHPLPLYFSPTNEKENESGEEIFLPDSPTNMIAQGRLHEIPFLIGVTSAEGIFLLKGK